MRRSTKIARVAVVTAVSLFVTMFAQADIMSSAEPVEKSVKTNVYEVTAKKTAKSSVEKPTEKSTEKPTQKPTEKTTEDSTEPTEAPTEEITEAPTEAPTELATMQIIRVVPEDVVKFSTLGAYDHTDVAPTEPATEWSQELQDLYDAQYDAGYLIAIDKPDYSYYPKLQINLSEEDKILACQIVQGEAGGEGYESCCLVAQCLKDSMISLGYKSIKEVQKYCKYDGWKEEYSDDAVRAVEYIFDQNQSAVAHRVLFFYATNLCTSKWHETQRYVVTVNKTRYFDMR